MAKKNMNAAAPSYAERFLYVFLAWGVVLLAITPIGLSIFAFPLWLGFIRLGAAMGVAAGWTYYLVVTVAVFMPKNHREFRYMFYILVISLAVNIGLCYKIRRALGPKSREWFSPLIHGSILTFGEKTHLIKRIACADWSLWSDASKDIYLCLKKTG